MTAKPSEPRPRRARRRCQAALFGPDEAVGQYIKVNDQWLRVIGVAGPQISAETASLGVPEEDRNNLIETVLISFVGGTIGVIAGVGISRLIGFFAGWSTIVTASSILLAFVVSVSVGLVFGLYPARRAARLDPIEALRYEQRVLPCKEMTRRSLIIGTLAPIVAACGVKVRPANLRPRYVQRGLASFYGQGDGYNGRLTASGSRFDKNALTAAHFDLPFGARIRVRNLKNDRHVDVTVTDRFPAETLRKGRILDVSYGAARKLRMIDDGIVPVELTVRA